MCKKTRIAQSTLEYVLVVVVAVVAMLATQMYIKRSMMGNLQLTTDQLASPYAPGLMNSEESFTSSQKIIELETAGWGQTTTITWVKDGHMVSRSDKEYRALTDKLVPGGE